MTGLAGANVTGQVGNALVAGTVYTAAQTNITSVGTLTDLSVSGNGVFGGNLTINGTLTYINSTTLSISDPIINLQTGANGAAPVANSGKDVGTALNYYDTNAKIAWMGWDVSNAEIAFGSNVSISSEVVTFTSLANIRSGNAQLGNAVTANYFIGSGNNLSNIAGANVSGAVSFATTANSVAGGNVSGAVGLATFATTANAVAGANVSGAVSFATTANAVAGANVSGTVSSASSATTAGSTTTVTIGGSVTTTTITTGANTTAGTITGNWSLSAGSQLRATYADLAEYYAASEKIEPGTVVEFGGEHEVQICNSYMSTLVTGIVTTDPAYIMNDGIECEYPVAIALQGRVPAKVIGPVKRGDMMVSANDGYAISCKSPSMGTVLGKALTDFNGEIGMIEIMVGRT